MDKLELNNLEQPIYMFVINVVSFIKTLKKVGYENNLTSDLASKVNSLNETYINLLDNFASKNLKIEIQNCKEISTKCHEILTKIDFDDKNIINEQADLIIEANLLSKQFSP